MIKLKALATATPRWTLSGDVGYYHVETFSKNNVTLASCISMFP